MATESTGLPELLDALRRRVLVLLLVAVPLLAGVVLYVQSLPDQYDGEAIVAFAPAPGTDVGADIVRLTVPKFDAYLSSEATAVQVARELGEDSGTLSAAVDATTAPDTPTMRVVVRLPDAERAADAANAFAQAAVDLAQTDDQLRGEVLAPALVPEEPASPPRRLLLAGGLLVALLVGASAAVVVDRSRPRIADPLTLALTTGHPTVGRIPRSKAVRRSGLSEALGDPVVGTAVRALRTQLDQQSRQLPVRVLAVTSPLEGDGKTTVAALLAASLARVDASVLLIDADMRRPRLAAALGLGGDHPGLSDLLDGSITLDQAVQELDVPGLSAVTTERRGAAGDLLARRMHAVLEEARERYDVVVLDCPPVLATDDARTLALSADGTLVVVGAGSETGKVAAATAALDSLNVRVVGTVLNRSRKARRGDLGTYGSYATARHG